MAPEAIVAHVPYADVNGRQLWYEENGAGDAVVFLHAGLLDSRQWKRQLETFGERYRAIAYDARGYGRSPAPTEPYRLHEDLLGLLDALGLERATFVGNSMGGKTAIDATLAAPERVSALVAVGAAVSGISFRAYNDDQGARAEAAWEAGDYEGAADVWLEVWAPLSLDDRVREIAYTNAAIDFDDFELDGDPPAAGRLGELRLPTLVVLGDNEVQGIVDSCRTLAAEVEGARLELLAGADHLPSLARPEEFDRIVLEFLDR
jgi:pimeloyl-ACP methyl ester carboxylesterase